MKLIINEDQCTGCQACIAVADEILDFDDNANLPVVKGGIDIENKKEEAEQAVAVCPFGAIVIEE